MGDFGDPSSTQVAAWNSKITANGQISIVMHIQTPKWIDYTEGRLFSQWQTLPSIWNSAPFGSALYTTFADSHLSSTGNGPQCWKLKSSTASHASPTHTNTFQCSLPRWTRLGRFATGSPASKLLTPACQLHQGSRCYQLWSNLFQCPIEKAATSPLQFAQCQ